MNGPGQYVTAFAGRRDGYQVAVALAEAGRLARLVTTFYLTDSWRHLAVATVGRIPAGLDGRRAAGLPDRLVTGLITAEAVEQTGRRLGLPPTAYWGVVNAALSRRAAAEADMARADLLLYEPYAPYAFRRMYRRHAPRKVLFHFHVHPLAEAAIFRDDQRRHPPATAWQAVDGGGAAAWRSGRPVRQAWRDADRILCASTFTRRTLEYAGADPARCRVVPYGVERPAECPQQPPTEGFRPLFVGSGTQRKGLHHLLAAWERYGPRPGDELTLVCRVVDPAIAALADAAERVTLFRGVSSDRLAWLYATATVLVVPSLAEGFGQVYLEAMARGCPVLGTPNTCVPDLGGEADGAFVTPHGDPDALADRLRELASRLPGRPHLRRAAWATAGRFTWERFRAGVRDALP